MGQHEKWRSATHSRLAFGVAACHKLGMSKPPTYVTAREALSLFMEGHTPPLDDAAMAALVNMTRTGLTKIRTGSRSPSLPIASAIEKVTGIPASAWHPTSDEQGKVSPAWLRKPSPPAPTKGRARRLAPVT